MQHGAGGQQAQCWQLCSLPTWHWLPSASLQSGESVQDVKPCCSPLYSPKVLFTQGPNLTAKQRISGWL